MKKQFSIILGGKSVNICLSIVNNILIVSSLASQEIFLFQSDVNLMVSMGAGLSLFAPLTFSQIISSNSRSRYELENYIFSLFNITLIVFITSLCFIEEVGYIIPGSILIFSLSLLRPMALFDRKILLVSFESFFLLFFLFIGYVSGLSFNATTNLVFYILGLSLPLIIYLLSYLEKYRFSFQLNPSTMKLVVSETAGMALATFLNVSAYTVTLKISEYSFTSSEAGIYTRYFAIFAIFSSLITSIIPFLISEWAKREIKIKLILRKYSTWILIYYLLLSLVWWIFGKQLIDRIWGGVYKEYFSFSKGLMIYALLHSISTLAVGVYLSRRKYLRVLSIYAIPYLVVPLFLIFEFRITWLMPSYYFVTLLIYLLYENASVILGRICPSNKIALFNTQESS